MLAMQDRTTTKRKEDDRLTWRAPGRVRVIVLLLGLVVGILICLLLAAPFLPALTWALALAIVFMPTHRWIEYRLQRPNAAAAVSVVLVASIVAVPVLLVGGPLLKEAAAGAQTVKDKIGSGEWLKLIEFNATTSAAARWLEDLNLPEAVANGATSIAGASTTLLGQWVSSLATILLSFYILFYFFRDRTLLLDALRDLSPLPDIEMTRLFRRALDTVYATLIGTVVVAFVQGVLGGLMFWWLEIPSPLLWGAVMGFLAVVPVLGAFIVWVPVALYLAVEGNWGQAALLTGWGTIVVGGIDNLLYPMLVGERLRLHTIPAFIAIIGGLLLFGASGLIIGPLVVSLTMFLFEVWKARLGDRAPSHRPAHASPAESTAEPGAIRGREA